MSTPLFNQLETSERGKECNEYVLSIDLRAGTESASDERRYGNFSFT